MQIWLLLRLLVLLSARPPPGRTDLYCASTASHFQIWRLELWGMYSTRRMNWAQWQRGSRRGLRWRIHFHMMLYASRTWTARRCSSQALVLDQISGLYTWIVWLSVQPVSSQSVLWLCDRSSVWTFSCHHRHWNRISSAWWDWLLRGILESSTFSWLGWPYAHWIGFSWTSRWAASSASSHPYCCQTCTLRCRVDVFYYSIYCKAFYKLMTFTNKTSVESVLIPNIGG